MKFPEIEKPSHAYHFTSFILGSSHSQNLPRDLLFNEVILARSAAGAALAPISWHEAQGQLESDGIPIKAGTVVQ